jgi:hypothetical protein
MIFGVPYDCEYELSTIQIRAEASGGGISVLSEGRLQIQRVIFQYSETGYFEVEITPLGRVASVYNPSTYLYAFNGRNLGNVENVIGLPALDTGEFSLPVMSRNDRVRIVIKSSSYLPFALTSVEWVGQHVMKSKRV